TGRPELAAFTPDTSDVQSAPVSSRHNPFSSCFIISPTRGGVPLAGFFGGLNAPTSLNGGFAPPCGPETPVTTFGGKEIVPGPADPPPSSVERLPDSKIAT